MAAHGYIEEEYFVAGTAQSFRPVGELGRDGRWQVVPDRRAPYKTRVIVHRPKDPAKFNGLVMAEWNNVSTFSDLSNAVNESFWQSGYVYISISEQKVGIHGRDAVQVVGHNCWIVKPAGGLVQPAAACSHIIDTPL